MSDLGYSNFKAYRLEEPKDKLGDIEFQKEIEKSENSDNDRESSVKIVRNNNKEIKNEKDQYLTKSKRKNIGEKQTYRWGKKDPLELPPSKATNSVHLQKALMKWQQYGILKYFGMKIFEFTL